MSRWATHSICDECWKQLEGQRVPARLKDEYRDHDECCWCGKFHWSGIYRRAEGRKIKCQGKCDF